MVVVASWQVDQEADEANAVDLTARFVNSGIGFYLAARACLGPDSVRGRRP